MGTAARLQVLVELCMTFTAFRCRTRVSPKAHREGDLRIEMEIRAVAPQPSELAASPSAQPRLAC
ncbi:hypothetical protein GCM10010504_27070 [Streptomyces griseus]|nr:hypothetical protein GCM10010504_27070 [Streptomyces griseus]